MRRFWFCFLANVDTLFARACTNSNHPTRLNQKYFKFDLRYTIYRIVDYIHVPLVRRIDNRNSILRRISTASGGFSKIEVGRRTIEPFSNVLALSSEHWTRSNRILPPPCRLSLEVIFIRTESSGYTRGRIRWHCLFCFFQTVSNNQAKQSLKLSLSLSVRVVIWPLFVGFF